MLASDNCGSEPSKMRLKHGNQKLTEHMAAITQSPEQFKGGTI